MLHGPRGDCYVGEDVVEGEGFHNGGGTVEEDGAKEKVAVILASHGAWESSI